MYSSCFELVTTVPVDEEVCVAPTKFEQLAAQLNSELGRAKARGAGVNWPELVNA